MKNIMKWVMKPDHSLECAFNEVLSFKIEKRACSNNFVLYLNGDVFRPFDDVISALNYCEEKVLEIKGGYKGECIEFFGISEINSLLKYKPECKDCANYSEFKCEGCGRMSDFFIRKESLEDIIKKGEQEDD